MSTKGHATKLANVTYNKLLSTTGHATNVNNIIATKLKDKAAVTRWASLVEQELQNFREHVIV